MHIIRLVLGGLLAVLVAAAVGVSGHLVMAQHFQYGRIIGFDPEGTSYVMAFALFALPALLLSLAAVRSVIALYARRTWQKLAVGGLGGAVACWAIFTFYSLALALDFGPVWPLALIMGATGGLVVALLVRPAPPEDHAPSER